MLGRFLPVSAAAAATMQQAFVSAIVELLIAAVLALPELLRSKRATEPSEARQGRDLETGLPTLAMEILPPTTLNRAPKALPKRSVVQETADERTVDAKPVIAFLAEHMPVARGSRADWGDIYSGFREWQTSLGQEAWPATQFGAVLRHICEQANIGVRRQVIESIAWIVALHGRDAGFICWYPTRSRLGGTARLCWLRSSSTRRSR
jgi:hypothetical protein